MENPLSYPKSKLIESITALNRRVLKEFIKLKQEFESTSIPNNEISNKLKVFFAQSKTWKPAFEQIVEEDLREIKQFWIKSNPSQEFTFSLLVKEITKIYAGDQEYTEAIKCLNSTIDMIKDYIRIKAIKDPTTAVVQKDLGNSENVMLGQAKSISV